MPVFKYRKRTTSLFKFWMYNEQHPFFFLFPHPFHLTNINTDDPLVHNFPVLTL